PATRPETQRYHRRTIGTGLPTGVCGTDPDDLPIPRRSRFVQWRFLAEMALRRRIEAAMLRWRKEHQLGGVRPIGSWFQHAEMALRGFEKAPVGAIFRPRRGPYSPSFPPSLRKSAQKWRPYETKRSVVKVGENDVLARLRHAPTRKMRRAGRLRFQHDRFSG